MWHGTAPWEFPFDFQLQGQTEERADENDQSQNEDVLQGGCYNDGPNDVASNEELETEQNRASDILPVKCIIIPRAMRTPKQKSPSGDQCATCDNKNTYAIHARADDFHDMPKIFHVCLHCRKADAFSMLFLSNALKATRCTSARLFFKRNEP
jgi:hypothetical protein